MKSVCMALSLAILVGVAPEMGQAQAGPALAEARSRVVCGAGTLVSANYIGNGLMRVTCRQEDKKQNQTNEAAQQTALTGTGLTAPTTATVVIAVGIIGALAGGGSDSTTTGPSVISTGER